MNSDESCLVARAIPLPGTDTNGINSKPKETTLEAITNHFDAILLEKTKVSPTGKSQETNKNDKNKIRALGGAISPADFVTMQSLRSSALARKMNTTSKLTRDCKNLFADLMQDQETIPDNSANDNNIQLVKSVEPPQIDEGGVQFSKSDVKSIEVFTEKMAKNAREITRQQNASKENKDVAKGYGEDEKQLISRGPIRICSRDVCAMSYHPYTNVNHGIAPQQLTNDPSNYNPNVYSYAYECGIGENYWPNSCDTTSSSNSSTPDTVAHMSEMLNGHDNSGHELPEPLSDFILQYSRRYTPSPDGSKFGEIDAASVWSDSPNSITSLGTSESVCNSPSSAISASNSSPTAPRGGQAPAYLKGAEYDCGGRIFGIQKQGSVDSGICGGTRIRPAKDRLRALIQNSDMDEAWAWTCKCIQHHPGALTYQDADKDTLLHIVSQHMDVAKIYALVEQMAKLENQQNNVPLFDVPNDKGQTPLSLAVEKRCNEVVDYLLEAGASPNTHKTINEKDAPLHYIVQTLCSYPQININAMNGFGFTPLLCAFKTHGVLDEEADSIVSSIGVIQLLLKHGADPTIADAINGKTIVHVAVERRQPELIEILRACLSDNVLVSIVNKLDLRGKSPLDYYETLENLFSPDIKLRIRLALVTCGAKQ